MADESEQGENLLRNSVDSNIEDSKSLSLKWKLIIIIGISILVLTAIGITLFFLLKGDKKDDEKEEDSIEVLTPIIINPISEYTHCIIWLHGMDNSPENFQDMFKVEVPFSKKDNTKIILMRAPYEIMSYNERNFTSWFDIFWFPINSSQSYNFTEATNSKRMLEKIINQEAKNLNGNYKNIFIGGHSQGACISLYTAYNFKELLGGVLVCSGVLFPQAEIIGNKNKLKVFLAHGENDKAIPLSFHNETVKRIENFEGVKKYYYKNHGHNIADYEKIDMGKFINDTIIENNSDSVKLNYVLKFIVLLMHYL